VTVPALLLSIVLGAGSLAWGYIGVGLPIQARWILVFGVVWLLAVWRRWSWFAHIGLTGYFLAAALGLWFLGFPPGWMFAGVTCGLLAWDLTAFRARQVYAASDAERRTVELRHLLRLSLLALLGFGLASLAMSLEFRLGFDWAAFVALVVALALSQIIRWFRSRA